MQDFMVSVEFILILILCCLAFASFILYMRWKMEGESIFKKELAYEIFYREECLKKGKFVLSDGAAYRFGYSKGEKYHNNIAIERFMDALEDTEEKDIAEIKKRYKTWFLVSMEKKRIFIKPSYSQREYMDGHKTVYLKDHILKDDGEELVNGAVFCSSDSEEPAFRVYVYDENAVIKG